jgi:acetyl esterase/lipase
MRMPVLSLAALVLALCAARSAMADEKKAPSVDPNGAPQVITLWPDGAPGAVGAEDADKPTLTVYLPPADKATGAAIVVCPGGGYRALAAHEGQPVAEWLNTLGVTAFVLKYRLAPRYHHPAPLQDASRAVRLVRARAADWKIDPQRIGILGFSAGGHVGATLGTHFDDGDPAAKDPVERVSSRPDPMVLIYPAISLTADFVPKGIGRMLLGDDAKPEQLEELSAEKHVTAQTPPAFLVHTAEDSCEHSLVFALALRKAKVPVELHLYEKGKHGYGLATKDPILKTWTAHCADWLSSRGFLKKQS